MTMSNNTRNFSDDRAVSVIELNNLPVNYQDNTYTLLVTLDGAYSNYDSFDIGNNISQNGNTVVAGNNNEMQLTSLNQIGLSFDSDSGAFTLPVGRYSVEIDMSFEAITNGANTFISIAKDDGSVNTVMGEASLNALTHLHSTVVVESAVNTFTIELSFQAASSLVNSQFRISDINLLIQRLP